MTTNPGLPPLYTCFFCGDAINPRQAGVWRKVSGWVQNRKQGGVNSISLPEPEIGYACNVCIDIAKSKNRGMPPQDSLF
jgi:hypothetical protein